MNLLFRVLYAAHCKSTHHKLAMDALKFLACPDVERWRQIFLKHHAPYLTGAKAPDTKFKDFRNHVLHVSDNYWGGATSAARLWYGRAVEQLKKGDWVNGVYAAGILSHYYTDPLMPFHTGQSEAENNIHRATEWSVTKSYTDLWTVLEIDLGFPTIDVPSGDDWLEQMVRAGAEASHCYYDELIAHYDFAAGSKNPRKGLDDHARRIIAGLLGHGVVGFAKILGRMIDEAAVTPPEVSLTAESAVATLNVPVQWVSGSLANRKERKVVKAMFQEFQQSGSVKEHLPEENRVIRDLVITKSNGGVVGAPVVPTPAPAVIPPAVPTPAVQPVVVSKPVSVPASVPAPAPQPASVEPAKGDRFYLELNSPIVDAPSIGPKMSERFVAIGIKTVGDLLALNPERGATLLNIPQLTPKLMQLWQDQARLCCEIANLRGHDSQILVACGYRTASSVASADPEKLTQAAIAIATSPEGQRVLRGCAVPDFNEVSGWIRAAQLHQPQRAAA